MGRIVNSPSPAFTPLNFFLLFFVAMNAPLVLSRLVHCDLPAISVLSCERFLTAPLRSVVADRFVDGHDCSLCQANATSRAGAVISTACPSFMAMLAAATVASNAASFVAYGPTISPSCETLQPLS